MNRIFLKVGIFMALFGVVSGAAFAGTLRVGCTPVPAGEILEFVARDMRDRGVELKIMEFTDFVMPNVALVDGQIDVSLFQHVPFMEGYNKDRKSSIAALEPIYILPIGLYSNKFKSLEEIPSGGTIAIPNDPTNGGRALLLLEERGLIKLESEAGLAATEFDIIENSKKLKFKAMEAAQIPRVLPDVGAALINGNYALQAGFNPLEDAILLEGANSPYSVVLSVLPENVDNSDVLKLQDALRSDKVRDFILQKYQGGAIPAF